MKAMKKTLFFVGILVMATVLFSLARKEIVVDIVPTAFAEPMAETASVVQTFGVVDMSRVMQTTVAAKDIFSQLDKRREEYQVLISKEEEGLRVARQEIEKQKGSLSREEFDKERRKFEKKVVSGQEFVNSRKQILDQAFNDSMSNLRDEAAKIVAKIAKEKSYSVVFTQNAVMLSDPSFDITDIVIGRLNKSVKKFPVTWPASIVQKEAPVVKSDKKK